MESSKEAHRIREENGARRGVTGGTGFSRACTIADA
jgi:hypothetical protein